MVDTARGSEGGLSSSSGFIYDSVERSRRPLRSALEDIFSGLRHVFLWGGMGWLDVQQRYSRSFLGPLWVTTSLGFFVFGIALTYGALFQLPLTEYLPFLTAGIITWVMLSSFLTDGCTTFTGAEAAIKQMRAPLSVHVFRMVWRNIIIFCHNFLVVIVVWIAFQVKVDAHVLLAVPGFALLVINGAALATSLGTLSARFRDISPFMANVVQMLFFMTPIFWRPEHLGDRVAIAHANPFFHLIELVRAPLLSASPPALSWAAAIAFTVVNVAIALWLYSRFRWRIPYWL